MASSTLSTASLLSARSPVASRHPSSRSTVRVFAVDKQAQFQAPRDAILKTFGAVAAAQLALSGAALADILPKSAESQGARDEINQRTSNLPTFGDVGNALKKNLGQNDPKDIGRAIDNATPDAPDLTKNPKEIGKDLKRGAQKVVGDLSDLPNPKQAINAAKNQAKNVGNDIGSAASSLGGSNAADKAGNKLKNAANSADRKVKNAVSEVSDLPNPKQAVNAAKNQAKNLKNDVGSVLGGSNAADKAGNKAKNLANSADRSAKNAVSDLSDLPELPNPFKGGADPENLAKDAKNKAQDLKGSVGSNLPGQGGGGNLRDLGGSAKRAAEDFRGTLQRNTPNPPSGGIPSLPGSGSGAGIPKNS